MNENYFMSKSSTEPYLIPFDAIGSDKIGFITVAQGLLDIPFEIKRVYWTYHTPNKVIRGGHAHKNLQQIIFSVSGKIIIRTEKFGTGKAEFVLDNPSVGLYLPPNTWRQIEFFNPAVLLCLASDYYKENDYIRSYQDFLQAQENR